MTQAVCNVIDLSNYSGDITDANAQCWKQQGIYGAIVGTQNPTIAIQQATVLLRNGFVVEFYAFLCFGLGVVSIVQQALSVAAMVNVTDPMVWLDCETTGPPDEATGETPALRCQDLEAARNAVVNGGGRAGIYTGAWYWPTYMGDTTQFSSLPLWHAGYPADHSLEATVNYGGWTQVAMHQFEGSVSLCGVTVDEDDDIVGICSHQGGNVTQPSGIDINDAVTTLMKVALRDVTDSTTGDEVDVGDPVALLRVLHQQDMGGLGIVNAVEGAQMSVAEMHQGKLVPPHTHVAGAVAVPQGLIRPRSLQSFAKSVPVYATHTATVRTPVKLGKLPYRHDSRTLSLARYIDVAKLPVAPRTLDLTKGVPVWLMYGNDQFGDCTAAACGHLIEVWTAEEAQEAAPSTAAVESMYWAITGGKDTGAVELDVLRYWRKYGLAGHKPYAFALVDPMKRSHIQVAASLFGGLYIGLALPLSAQQQTGPGCVWMTPEPGDISGQPGSWGGHAVNVVGYDETTVTVVTWGKLQKMSWPFFQRYCDEAWAILPAEWAHTPPDITGFDFNAFDRDLAEIGKVES